MNTSQDPILLTSSQNNVNYESFNEAMGVGRNPKTPSGRIPVRYIMAAIVLMATFTTYNCRFNLSIAIVEMSNYTDNSANKTSSGSDVCSAPVATNHTNGTSKNHQGSNGEFDWDQKTQGVILGAFFYGYVLFQVLGGRLAELFGAKWLCAVSLALSSLLNALTPIIARARIYWLLLASRVVLGAFQSVLFPACYALVAKWTPEHERSVVLSLPLIGGNIGTIVTSALTGYLTEEGFAGGWPSVFYVSVRYANINNNVNSKTTASNGIAGVPAKQRTSVPWLKIFTSLPGVFLYGLRGGGDVPVDADMTLQYVGTVFAIANSIAFTCGIMTPLVIGVIVGDGTEHVRRQWAYVFYMSAALNVFGGLVFVVFGSAKQQEWDKQPVSHSIELNK
ncbi:unnamed protein product [Medioppia subpectinata]|uniref:Major facilitator superfamily (MFS) profile domain-containing protein n=1 Tax=Medioppia subpectinata TaxID=1979941 RepID=A0A7R9L0X7_9ACAR|nr:unnamed protein product [Medioppia subpectinata]CAG2113555.1 unnamed protein product [Medioppia subpectinata]